MRYKKVNDWPLKLLAMVLSFVMWLVVVTYTDPTIKKTYEVPVEFENADILSDRNQFVEIVDKTVSVTVKAKRSVMNKLKTDDIKARADFEKMYQDTRVPVSVSSEKVSKSSMELLDSSVQVRVEDIISVTKPIEYMLTGAAAQGYIVGDVRLSPESVTLTGPESLVQQVRSAAVMVDVNDVKESFSLTAPLLLRDEQEAEIDYNSEKALTMDCSGVVSCEVRTLVIQSLPVVVVMDDSESKAAPGCRYIGYELSDDSIIVSGDKAEVSKLFGIEITDMSVAGADEDVVKTVDIRTYLPEGIDVYGDSHDLTVTFNISRLVEKSFAVDADSIRVEDVPDNCEYRITDEDVHIVLRGISEDMALLNSYEGQLSVSLKGLSIGQHQLPLLVTLPSAEYEQVGTASVNVEIAAPAAESGIQSQEVQ